MFSKAFDLIFHFFMSRKSVVEADQTSINDVRIVSFGSAFSIIRLVAPDGSSRWSAGRFGMKQARKTALVEAMQLYRDWAKDADQHVLVSALRNVAKGRKAFHPEHAIQQHLDEVGTILIHELHARMTNEEEFELLNAA